MKDLVNVIKFNFLYVDKYSFGRTWVYPESPIPYSMLRCVLDGSAEFKVNGESYILKKGQISYIPEGCTLYCKALEDTFSFISIRFKTSVYYDGANFLAEYYNIPLVMDGDDILKEYFYNIYNWVFQDSVSKMFHIRGNLELIIARILDNNALKSARPVSKEYDSYSIEAIKKRIRNSTIKDDPRIRAVVDYIVSHPTEKHTSKKMSAMVDLAQTTFRRLFKQQTGKTPVDFIRDIRLTTAVRKLLISNISISELAYELGFEDPNYFIRIFKKNYGMTPRQYRNSMQE